MHELVFSVTLRRDISNFREIAHKEESSPRCLFNMWIDVHILIPNSVTGGQRNAIQSKYGSRYHICKICRTEYNNFVICLNL